MSYQRTLDAQMLLRMTAEQREALKQAAQTEGKTFQEFAMERLLGQAKPIVMAGTPVAVQAIPSPAPAETVAAAGLVQKTPPLQPLNLGKVHTWPWEAKVAAFLQAGRHVFLVSDGGLGKTMFANAYALQHKRPLYQVTCSFGVERDALEGAYRPVIVEGTDGQRVMSIEAFDGILTSAAETGAVCLIEELPLLPGDIQGRLLSALNPHRGYFDVVYRGAAVPVHPDFRVIATGNPPGRHYKADRINLALLSRFVVEDIPFPTPPQMANFLRAVGFTKETAMPAAEFARDTYTKFDQGQLDAFVSPRDLRLFVEMVEAKIDPEDAFYGAVANKFALGRPVQERQQIRKGLWDDYQKRLPQVRT